MSRGKEGSPISHVISVKSLLCILSVAKPWNAIISDNEFKKAHRDQSKALGSKKCCWITDRWMFSSLETWKVQNYIKLIEAKGWGFPSEVNGGGDGWVHNEGKNGIPRVPGIEGFVLKGFPDSDASTAHGELTIWEAVPDVFILLNRMTKNVGIGDTIMEVLGQCKGYVTQESFKAWFMAMHASGLALERRVRSSAKNKWVMEGPWEITFKEIIAATNNFSYSRRVAEIDFGTAYHGFLDNNQHVLVKRLGMKTCPALRVRFSNELQNLGRLRHRNLVQLRGWCTEQGEMLVIYDYSQSSLLSHLLFHHNHHRDNVSILRRRHRYNIVKSLASAIRYLHEEWDEQVIHRCITSSAIILDPDMNPRLGFFALAEFLTRNEHSHHVVVDKNKSVRGIFSYMSPEHMDSGDATTMADVYSFGVVLLEIVSGQMAVDFRRPEALLVNRVHEFEVQKRPYEQLADFRLNGNFNSRELVRLVKLGMACTRSDPESRPTMRQIVNILDGHDQWLMENGRKKEKPEEWRTTNTSALSLVRRIQALGIQ
ncbi:Receptor like protein kinase S.2 [Capsicum annuum]|uniref:Receptor like protein kinase S.2 n=1 Tax=Capsicum annuum TaxID=4072 RepID=A0A2G2ZTG8_CAPAN|nr:Receptor like protein kinase S.2 [Capsicum annuum]